MTLKRIKADFNENRGQQVDFELICKDENELITMIKAIKSIEDFDCDFPETSDDGRESITFMIDFEDIAYFREVYKTAKKNMK